MSCRRGNEKQGAMVTGRLTRRQALVLGLGGIALSRPLIGGGKAMAEYMPDTVVLVCKPGRNVV
ncbi:MAG: hypothetical protein ABW318_01510 [Vicinamibacterales bacterium]